MWDFEAIFASTKQFMVTFLPNVSLCSYICLLIFVSWKQDLWAKSGTTITYWGEVRFALRISRLHLFKTTSSHGCWFFLWFWYDISFYSPSGTSSNFLFFTLLVSSSIVLYIFPLWLCLSSSGSYLNIVLNQSRSATRRVKIDIYIIS